MASYHAPGNQEGYLPTLDGWRAVAVLLVLFSHHPYSWSRPPWWIYQWNILFDGDLGVRIFFVVSGLLITLLLVREEQQHQQISLKRFYIRRALRILPIYVLYLLVLASLQSAGLYQDHFSSWLGSVTFTRNYLGRGDSATQHFWSLAIEEQFYATWPLLAAACLGTRRRWLLHACLAGILIAVLIRWLPSDVWSGTIQGRLLGLRSILRYLDSLLVGCAAALYFENAARHLRSQVTPVLAMGALLVGKYAPYWTSPSPNLYAALAPTIQALAVVTLILWTIHHPRSRMHHLLESGAARFIGRLSYSLYVWHFMFLAHFMGPRLEGVFVYDWKWWWIASLLAAYTSHRYVEQPFLRLKKRFASVESAHAPVAILNTRESNG